MSLNYKHTKELVLKELSESLADIDNIQELIDVILSAEKIFFIGVGRVFLALQCIAKRLNHLGISTFLVGQITEPAITEKDILIVGSGSGESLVPLGIAKKAKILKARIVHIGANPKGAMKEYTDLFIRIPVKTKLNLPDEIQSSQPMTTLFEQSLLLLGDILALMIIDQKNIDIHSLWQFHANLE